MRDIAFTTHIFREGDSFVARSDPSRDSAFIAALVSKAPFRWTRSIITSHYETFA